MDIEDEKNKSIGFFDSGVGGISVLKEAVKLMPYENYVYFGDSSNAPYGTKSAEEVRKLTLNAAEYLYSKNIKAMVIACNTATSAAIGSLRSIYKIPVIGIEPALKPAVELHKNGKIIIMATPVTLSEHKFKALMDQYSYQADISPMPCAGLADLVEKGIIDGEIIKEYIKNKFQIYKNDKISAVVLGCTHYSFIKSELISLLDKDIKVIDGSQGTSKQLKRLLIKRGLLKNETCTGSVHFFNSLQDKEAIELSDKLFKL